MQFLVVGFLVTLGVIGAIVSAPTILEIVGLLANLFGAFVVIVVVALVRWYLRQ
jgi:hypothetical protein